MRVKNPRPGLRCPQHETLYAVSNRSVGFTFIRAESWHNRRARPIDPLVEQLRENELEELVKDVYGLVGNHIVFKFAKEPPQVARRPESAERQRGNPKPLSIDPPRNQRDLLQLSISVPPNDELVFAVRPEAQDGAGRHHSLLEIDVGRPLTHLSCDNNQLRRSARGIDDRIEEL